MAPSLAHETWFVRDDVPADFSFAGEPLTLALLAVAVIATAGVRLIARVWPGTDVPFLGRMAPYVPFVVRMHLAVALIGLLSLGFYLSPAMDLRTNAAGILLGAVMVVVAVLMVAGWHVREGALLLVLAGPIGMVEFGFLPVVQRVDMLGPALFLLATGGGRWSADHELGRSAEPSLEAFSRAVWAIRVATGVALVVVAFVEKLAQPGLALKFLAEHPEFNLAAQIGIGWTDLEFIRVAGGVEVLFGLLLISGAAPQLIVVAAGIPFNATLYFFGEVELMGHLPVYGTMLVLLVLGSSPEHRPTASVLWPWKRRSGRRGQAQTSRAAASAASS